LARYSISGFDLTAVVKPRLVVANLSLGVAPGLLNWRF